MTSKPDIGYYPARGVLWVAVMASVPAAAIVRYSERTLWTVLIAGVLWGSLAGLVQYSGAAVERRGVDIAIVGSIRRVRLPLSRISGTLWLDAFYFVTVEGLTWSTKLGSRANFQNTVDSRPARRLWPQVEALGGFARLSRADAGRLARAATDPWPRKAYFDGWAWPTPLMWVAHIGVTALLVGALAGPWS